MEHSQATDRIPKVGDIINYRGKNVLVGRIDGAKMLIEWTGHQKWVPLDIEAVNQSHVNANYRNTNSKIELESEIRKSVAIIVERCDGDVEKLINEALKVGVAAGSISNIRELHLSARVGKGMAAMRVRNLIAGAIRRHLKSL